MIPHQTHHNHHHDDNYDYVNGNFKNWQSKNIKISTNNEKKIDKHKKKSTGGKISILSRQECWMENGNKKNLIQLFS